MALELVEADHSLKIETHALPFFLVLFELTKALLITAHSVHCFDVAAILSELTALASSSSVRTNSNKSPIRKFLSP